MSELLVALALRAKDYRLISHRRRICGVEVDLVMKGAEEVVIFEVKRVVQVGIPPLSRSQWVRLRRVFMATSAQRVHLAMVDIEANVEVCEDVLALD